MDTSGLTSVTTPAEMITWLAANCITPIQPVMTGNDFGVIIEKVISLGGGGSSDAQIAAYLKSLPGYVGDGSKFLADDLTWRSSLVSVLTEPVPTLTDSSATSAAISWLAIDGAVTYTIERALDNGFTDSPTTVYSGSALSYSDTSLIPETEYFYRVKASAPGLADSPWSVTLNTQTTPPPSGKEINIVVGNSFAEVLSGWTTVDNTMGTDYALIDASGQSLDWNLVISSTAAMAFETIQSVNELADFPQAICDQQWYGSGNCTCVFTFSGLDISKTYRVKTCSGDQGFVGNGTTIISCNGSATQAGDPDNNTFELGFPGIAPDSSGNLAVTITSTGGNPIINAMILTEL